jgi:predicted ATP-grasp superfamily ATP-dependent carboligase
MGNGIVIAARSARMLAQSARQSGLRPIALDLFGDTDTRRAAHWLRAGGPDSHTFDPNRLHDTLARLARRDDLIGWVAGAGFEGHPAWLDRGARHLRLLGNDAATVSYVKDPRHFFGLLDALDIAHPEVRFTPPDTLGWLRKQVGGSGGRHVRRWVHGMDPKSPATHYFQRECPGTPMSLLFLADGDRIAPIGFNRLLCEPLALQPFAFGGVIGPVPLAPAPAADVLHAATLLASHLGLCGLNGIDFILHRGEVQILEINPRPPATLALYDARVPGGLMRAHVDACDGRLADVPRFDDLPAGIRVVYADRDRTVTAQEGACMAAAAWVHDLPRAGARITTNEPWCSVSANGRHVEDVAAMLAHRAAALRTCFTDEDARPLPAEAMAEAGPALA